MAVASLKGPAGELDERTSGVAALAASSNKPESGDCRPEPGWRWRSEHPSLGELNASIPVPHTARFWRKLLAFAGPGLMVSVGYMDPGKWATDLAGGARFGYTLLGVILILNLIAILPRRLSLRLGVGSERNAAPIRHDPRSRPAVIRLPYGSGSRRHCRRTGNFELTLATAVLGGVLLTGCEKRSGGNESDRRPLVVCTTTMITDLAHQIAGERVKVVGILPPRTDPHIYEPKPEDSVLFRKAGLVLYNGLHLEGRMLHIIENAGTKAVALAEDPRIKPRASSTVAAGAPDPHCWWDARHFMVYAERARDALIRMDPGGEAEYRRRTDDYLRALSEADANVRERLGRLPPEQRYLITSHDAFYYYGAAYGLEVSAVLGISTDASVRALRIDELARLVVKNRIRAIFHETSVSASLNEMINRVVELAAREGHIVVVPQEALYSDSIGAPGSPSGTYLGALQENTRIIVDALSGRTADSIGSAAESRP